MQIAVHLESPLNYSPILTSGGLYDIPGAQVHSLGGCAGTGRTQGREEKCPGDPESSRVLLGLGTRGRTSRGMDDVSSEISVRLRLDL